MSLSTVCFGEVIYIQKVSIHKLTLYYGLLLEKDDQTNEDKRITRHKRQTLVGTPNSTSHCGEYINIMALCCVV